MPNERQFPHAGTQPTRPEDAPGGGPARRSQFNVLLSPEDFARLDALAAVLQRSRASAIRQVLIWAHQMTVQGVPTCASGQFCPMPQLHQRTAPHGVQGAER